MTDMKAPTGMPIQNVDADRRIKRIFLVVLDGVGAGELPDADKYGDVGSNTLAHTAQAVGGLNLPNMGRLGLGHVTAIEGVPPDPAPLGCWGKMREASPGKDTITGHWEMAGVILSHPFPTYPNGFPSRDHPGVRAGDWDANIGQSGGVRHGHHSGAGSGTRPHGVSHRVHVGGQRVSNRHARAGDPYRAAVRNLRDRPQSACRPPRGRARDLPPV